MLMILEPILVCCPLDSLYYLASFNPLPLEGYKCKGNVWGGTGREKEKNRIGKEKR